MAKTDYQRGYGKGYYAGSRGAWPDHIPPAPPDEITAELIGVLRDLRDGVDSEIATFGEDDEVTLRLGALVDRVDDVLAKLSGWIRTYAKPE